MRRAAAEGDIQGRIYFALQKMIDSGVYVPGSHSWLAQVYAAEGRLDSAVVADL